MGNQIISSVLTVLVLNLFIGLTMSGISNAGHIGGFIGGVAFSYMLGANIDDKKIYDKSLEIYNKNKNNIKI